MSFEPIAVIGRACVLPGALDPAALWEAVSDGRDLLGRAPPGRWRAARRRILGSPENGPDHAWSDLGGYVTGFDEIFDPHGFALSADELTGLDPLVRWLLHVSRQVLREAGTEGGPRAGAIFGNLSFPSAGMSRHAERVWLGTALADAAGIPPADPRDRFMSGLPAHIVARALNLGAGAFCLDAACASSLYAVKLACDRLHDRSADVMLAGAVNCADDLFIHVGFSALRALSRTGRSRPFHPLADGLVPAEGAAAVALRRLADAESRGDRIVGVIRGVGLSNDGRAGSLLTPSEEGEVRAMRAAYAAAGIDPAEVSLVECHATGTLVGDAIEARSMRQVFAGAPDLPLGSLKSNMGHAVAAAGIAGLLKVLGAMEHGSRPATLHADRVIDELGDPPLRLLGRTEPWDASSPRLAGVNAFGFGGNNAHLIIEEYAGRRRPWVAGSPIPQSPGLWGVAVVGMGTAVGRGASTQDFETALFGPAGGSDFRAHSIVLPAAGLAFPPNDLARALPQHLWVLASAREALTGVPQPEGDRVGAFVGMGCDPEVARYGARWRLSDWAAAWDVPGVAWAIEAADAFAPPLDPAGVLGSMPNIPANRLNVQFDLRGPGFTLAAEELSGIRALEVACRALRAGEIDLALAGAADFSSEPVHQVALRAIGGHDAAGDGAVVLVLKRAEDAERDGDRVLALIDQDDCPALPWDVKSVEDRFGLAHAAVGLVNVAAAVLCCARGRFPGGEPWKGGRAVRLDLDAIGGARASVNVRSAGEAVVPPGNVAPAAGDFPREYPAHAQFPLLPPLPESDDPIAVFGPPEPPPGAQPMPPAPRLPPVNEPEDRDVPGPAPGIAEPAADLLAAVAAQHVMVARAHRQFIENQAAAHRRFLEVSGRAVDALLAAAVQSGKSTPAPAPSPLSGIVPEHREKPRIDRQGLMTHAAGRLSEVFGARFEPLDGLRRRVRMPEPPLLLADRVVAISAEPASMGTGIVVTETDVTAEAWYLHQGRMPPGIMIEAGQADLLLISWLGIDFHLGDERVYRLLGCDLTFHAPPPMAGDTLRYEISVDGHATQGAVRLFSFHYDCTVGGRPLLSVRGGQAGFFTDAELADSKGIRWEPADAALPDGSRLDPPEAVCRRRRFSRGDLESFAAGRVWECFGEGFEIGKTHTRPPCIAGGRMLLLDEVTDFDPSGGPWRRGYLRAVDAISPDDWFFRGHFTNDPCMPGTLMFEGCLQAMATYLAAMGFTLARDGWRFEPVTGETFPLRCRGQVTPESRELVYEIFVSEMAAAPMPTLRADLLCTVDGLKAFYCRAMGLRLAPGWPLDTMPEAAGVVADRKPAASVGDFSFDHRSLLACAWGRPTEAFGPSFAPFDGPRRLPRLPGPPYHFMSRVVDVGGEMGGMRVGSHVEVEYDVPLDAWYFDAGGPRVMPFAVLLEVALQPCGWLALYVGSVPADGPDLAFRNLDGTGRLSMQVSPEAGTIRTRAVLTGISRSGGMVIESFEVVCFVGGHQVYELETVFGFFPKEALAAQKGLPEPEGEREILAQPSPEAMFDMRAAADPRLAAAPLLMLDRITGIWPAGGPAGLGRFRAEMDVDPASWFFKAHFFQDPVQPGSLGLEAMLQLLQFAMRRIGLADGAWAGGEFEAIALGEPLTWKYRGQVLPANKRVVVLLDLVRLSEEGDGRLAVADASLRIDGLRIYEATGLAMRLRRPGTTSPGLPPRTRPESSSEEVLDPASQSWIADHRPTWTVPAMPLMAMADRLALAATRVSPGLKVVALEDVRALRWLPLTGPVRLRAEARRVADDRIAVTLLAWNEASRPGLSRFEPVATGLVRFDSAHPAGGIPIPPPEDAVSVPDPYVSGHLFHGPSFRLLRDLRLGGSGSTAFLDATAGGPPRGMLHEALLDALTHGIPHDELHRWSGDIDVGLVAYPHRIAAIRFHGEMPRSGMVRLETRFAGFDGDLRFPLFAVQAAAGDRLVAAMELVEVLLPKGPLGSLPPDDRRAFLGGRRYVPGARLSETDGETTRLDDARIRASDWMPGTVAGAYDLTTDDPLAETAVKEHVAHATHVHPGSVRVDLAAGTAVAEAEPLTVHPIAISRDGASVTVRDAAQAYLDLGPVRAFWDRWFNIGRWPVEDLFYGLAERFVSRVRLSDSAAFNAFRGRPLLFLGNHQVGVESLMFSIIASGLTGTRTMTLAKIEHWGTWLGSLIRHAFAYPGVADPGVITYFDRSNRDELPRILAFLAREIRRHGKSVMVHVEGTRSLACRAPVVKMSGAFLEMALATGTPVVPVRFTGGLPVEPLAARIEFPVGMGRQEIHIGRPILPGELGALNYRERKERVIAAINALGVANGSEEPSEGNAGFAAAAEAWDEHTGAGHEHSVLFEILQRIPEPCRQTRRLLEGAMSGNLSLADDDGGRWLAELARRLFGDGGPSVSVGN